MTSIEPGCDEAEGLRSLLRTNTGEPYAAPVSTSGLLERDHLVSQYVAVFRLCRSPDPLLLRQQGVLLFQGGQIAPWQRAARSSPAEAASSAASWAAGRGDPGRLGKGGQPAAGAVLRVRLSDLGLGERRPVPPAWPAWASGLGSLPKRPCPLWWRCICATPTQSMRCLPRRQDGSHLVSGGTHSVGSMRRDLGRRTDPCTLQQSGLRWPLTCAGGGQSAQEPIRS
jgi:hypothetical protein